MYFFSQYVFTYLESKKIEPNATFRKIVVVLCFAIFFLELGVDLASDDLTQEWSATEIVISWLATGIWGVIMTGYIFYYRKQLGRRAFILFAVYCIWPFIAGAIGAFAEELSIDILSLTILITCIFAGLQVSENTSHKLFEKLSYHDAMTGFYNKNYLIKNPDDFKRTLPCSYVIFDLNHLKRINDSYGHKKGDEYIRNFANFLKSMVPEEAETIRTGGDEFLVILPKYDQEKSQAFLDTYATKSQIQGISDSAAYGFAVRTTGVQTEDEVIAAADEHMYQQKKASREGR
ncbi:GGDEF domain-containing protein [Fibrobacter sp.]|uniref:GGDEF domain-containing protein n=1 Tax=Fibrobacter sp. TaxID=35828 RepID=UPI00386D43AC